MVLFDCVSEVGLTFLLCGHQAATNTVSWPIEFLIEELRILGSSWIGIK